MITTNPELLPGLSYEEQEQITTQAYAGHIDDILQAPSELSVEEQDQLTINALLGAVEDLSAEINLKERDRSDEEILSALQGIYNRASEHYDGNLAQTMELFDAFAMRLGEMACNHDHFMENALQQEQHGSTQTHDHTGHDHRHHAKDEEDKKNDKKSKKKKKKSIFS